MEKNAELADYNDTVWCAIYPDFSYPTLPSVDELHNLQLQVLQFLSPYTSSYIWQHLPFSLSIAPSPIPHLWGSLRYGDNVDDEWFLVYLLFALTTAFSSISVRLWDSDGEFLLIEAAFHLPRWLDTETSENRVFVRKGSVFIIPKSAGPGTPSLIEALNFLIHNEAAALASKGVQTAIHKVIRDYPEKAERNMHRVRVRVPVSVAAVLKQEPYLISLAVEGFYDRDVDAMKYASKMGRFLSVGEEMVLVSIKMSRTMYAQLVQQRFQPPKCYPMREGKHDIREAELGMKIACGFEMMYGRRKAEGEEGKGNAWTLYIESLQKSGFFKELLPGSDEYRRLMSKAVEYYKSTSLFLRTSEMLNAPVKRIDEILAQPLNMEDFNGGEVAPSDDDSWLFNGEDELNQALQQRQEELDEYAAKKRKDESDVAKAMHAFVEKVSTFEGAEIPEEMNLKDVNLDVDQFFKDMESVINRECEDSYVEGDELSDDLDDECGEEDDDMFMHAYSNALSEQMKETTLKKSFVRGCEKEVDESGSCSKDTEDFASLDVDFNLVASLLDSFNSQQGQPGPASNLLGLMGLKLPREPKDSK